ncbi:DUF2726 domain-containing protein [Chromobacterium amazonense]|uniref:DUF2726 domain-containing protein n=1 Tax=Chromobacterium amazonense TaxID=1382803 RepID=UPI003F7AC21A
MNIELILFGLLMFVAVVLVFKFFLKIANTTSKTISIDSKDTPSKSPYITNSKNEAACQIEIVSDGVYEKKSLMNKPEYLLFRKLETLMADYKYFRIFPQVSLGEILSARIKKDYSIINSKRVDFVVIDERGYAIAVIEYQGNGHYQGNAVLRDTVKREACRKAGVGFIEIPQQYGAGDFFPLTRLLDIAHNNLIARCEMKDVENYHQIDVDVYVR